MRKFLSLLLALVMTMSLVTISAGAADFTDDSDIVYDEAIDVISAIGVVDGYSDGSFKPTTQLNRGQAAKIITNMILGPTAASALSATAAPFKDVPANHTFAAQIAYCSQQGIINGYSDGSFQPGGTLTGYAFLKMLEGALGYDGNVEGFTGGNWTINVAKIANGIGLLDGVAEGFSGTATVDRQTACLFAFNTLKADLVEYDSKITATVAGVDVTIGGSNGAKSVTAENQSSTTNNYNIVNESPIDDRDHTGRYTAVIQFAERHFPRLVRNNGEFRYNDRWGSNYNLDDLGRPSTTWTYRGENIGTYKEEPVKRYLGNVSITDIYNDLEMNTATNAADHGTATVFVNGLAFGGASYDEKTGRFTVDTDGVVTVKRNSSEKVADFTKGFDFWLSTGLEDKDIASAEMKKDIKDGVYPEEGDKKLGDGTVVEVYRNDKTNDVIIDVISVYGGKVSSVNEGTSKRDDYVKVEYGNEPTRYPVGMNDKTNWYETTGLAEDDVISYTFSNKSNSIQSMGKIESVEGSLARRTVGKNLTLGDTTYKYSKEYNFEYGLTEEGLTNKSNYRVYLDEKGNALWIEEAEFDINSYVLIERISCEQVADAYGNTVVASHTLTDLVNGKGPKKDKDTNSIWDGNKAQVIFADGSRRTIALDRSYFVNHDTTRDFYCKSAISSTGGASLEFWAGDVVRLVERTNGSYSLSSNVRPESVAAYETNKMLINNYFLTAFNNDDLGATNINKDDHAVIDHNALYFDNKQINADSNTVFVVAIQNAYGATEYKTFTGIKNAPTVYGGNGFAFMRGNVAKLVFITSGYVKNVSRDVTFITGASCSKLVKESDTRQYYVYDAVVRGEITSIKIDANIEEHSTPTSGKMDPAGDNFTIGSGKGEVMIVNNYISDIDDIITDLDYDWASTSVQARGGQQGIKKISADEVSIGANGGNTGLILPVASNVKVFLADDGGGIEAITMDDVKTRRDVKVYYTTDDGEITNLFILEIESE